MKNSDRIVRTLGLLNFLIPSMVRGPHRWPYTSAYTFFHEQRICRNFCVDTCRALSTPGGCTILLQPHVFL